jgi:hypothetical protein
MFGSITKLFSGLFGLIGKILTLPLKLLSVIGGVLGSILTLPLKLFSSGKGKKAAPKQKSGEAFFLEESDAKGFKAPATKAKPAAAPVAATATALNLPLPTVTPSAPATPVNNYAQFGPARRPGANMKSFLDMAKTMKGA